MMMPGRAPLTPPSNEPAVSTVPSLNSLVASPKYQTLPSRSCAYQSKVSSIGLVVDGDCVVDDDGVDAHDLLGVAGDLGGRALQPIRRGCLINRAGTRRQREVRIVYLGREVRRHDRRRVGVGDLHRAGRRSEAETEGSGGCRGAGGRWRRGSARARCARCYERQRCGDRENSGPHDAHRNSADGPLSPSPFQLLFRNSLLSVFGACASQASVSSSSSSGTPISARRTSTAG